MSGKRILDALKELEDFATGKSSEPLTLYMPDGNGGLVERTVYTMDEYHAAWTGEGHRIVAETSA